MKKFLSFFLLLSFSFVLVSETFSTDKTDFEEFSAADESVSEDFSAVITEETFVPPAKLKCAVTKGIISVPFAYLLETESENIDFSINENSFDSLKLLARNKADVCVLPLEIAKNLMETASGKYEIEGVTQNFAVYVVTTDDKVNLLADLLSRKVYIEYGNGFTSRYVSWILESNSIEKGKSGIIITPASETEDIVLSIVSNNIAQAVLCEPYATLAVMKSKKVRRVISFQDEYEALNGMGKAVPANVLVVSSEFKRNHPDLLESFCLKYKKATDWTNKNIGKAGLLNKKYELGLERGLCTACIPNSNFVFIPADEVELSEELLFP